MITTLTPERVQSALDHHLEQLQQLGATLEDDVCDVLRTLLKELDEE